MLFYYINTDFSWKTKNDIILTYIYIYILYTVAYYKQFSEGVQNFLI